MSKSRDLSNLEFFINLKKDTINNILKKGEIRSYKSGDILFHDKEDVSTIYFVISGAVSLYKINENGQKKVIFILDKGKIINEVIIKELPASINCEVMVEGEILGIEKNELLRIMEEDFELCKNIIISLSMKTRRMYRQLKNTQSSIKIEKKLAAKLYKLGRDYGESSKEGIIINMDLSITYLADLLGSSRETVSRAMKVLQKEGLVKHSSKRIIIPNLNSLSTFFKAL